MAPIVNFGKVTAGYGVLDSVHKTPHTGIDFCVPSGTPLYAPLDGVISRIADYGDTSLGKAVFVQMKDGSQYVLGHLSSIKVKVGQTIHHGDLIALSGSSGRSTGAHLTMVSLIHQVPRLIRVRSTSHHLRLVVIM